MSCPNCESDKVYTVGFEFDGDWFYTYSHCDDCNAKFADIYEYHGTQIVEVLDNEDKEVAE